MNAMSFPIRFPWLPTMAIVVFSGSLFLCDWLVWTPMQRYYFVTYLTCELFGDRASSVEVRWLFKTGADGKQEFTVDADVVPVSSSADRRIPVRLSPAARQAGWTGLIQGSGEWLPIAIVRPFLQAQFYSGKSFWRLLLTPLLGGAAMFFFLLAGWSVLQNRTLNNRWDMEMIEWGEPPPSLIQRWWAKMGRVRFRLPEFWKQRRPEIALKPLPPEPDTAPAELLKKPRQPVLPLFGAPNGRQKEGFAWDEHNGIE